MSTYASPFWIDRESERKSCGIAASLTLGLLLALNLALLLQRPLPLEVLVPKGDSPVVLEIRRVAPSVPALPAVREQTDTRKLLAAEATPESLVLPDPQEPTKTISQPLQKPVPQAHRTKPVRSRSQNARPAIAPIVPQSSTAEAIDVQPGLSAQESGGTLGHSSGSENAHDGKDAQILTILLHAVEEYKNYPRQARRAGIEGRVLLRVSISAEGRVVAYELARLSGTGMLDDATQKLGKRLIGLDVPPAKGKAVTFVVPVQYILTK